MKVSVIRALAFFLSLMGGSFNEPPHTYLSRGGDLTIHITPFSLFFTSCIFGVVVFILALERFWLKRKKKVSESDPVK
jgi:hypothetical protein